MPARTRRRYTEEFKREAVRLVCESCSPRGPGGAGPRHFGQRVVSLARPSTGRAEAHGTYTGLAQRAEAEELTRVKREVASRVTQERDFLKRAAAFFARESQ